VKYLLDTNACIALINGEPNTVRIRFRQALKHGATVSVSTVAAFELWYGVAKSGRPAANAERVETFFSGPVDVLQFDDADARSAGNMRANLEKRGTPIGAYDLLIAGQALKLGAVLVTDNEREFGRVPHLVIENWTQPDSPNRPTN
jgi:tRNA(fMet)-specific endonuclease VapC